MEANIIKGIRDLFLYEVRKLKIFTRRNVSSKKSFGLKNDNHIIYEGKNLELCIIIWKRLARN